MVRRSRGRWWLNAPWYTDWALWVAAGTGLAVAATTLWVNLEDRATYPISTAWVISVAIVGFALNAWVWLGVVVVVRGACRATFHVPPGPLGVSRQYRVRIRGGGNVTFTRNRDGTVSEHVAGVKSELRARAVAAARSSAAARGFAVEAGRGDPPTQAVRD